MLWIIKILPYIITPVAKYLLTIYQFLIRTIVAYSYNFQLMYFFSSQEKDILKCRIDTLRIDISLHRRTSILETFRVSR